MEIKIRFRCTKKFIQRFIKKIICPPIKNLLITFVVSIFLGVLNNQLQEPTKPPLLLANGKDLLILSRSTTP